MSFGCWNQSCLTVFVWQSGFPTAVLLPGWRSLVGYSPWGRLRVGHDWATSHSLFTFMHWRRKWQPTPVFLPWESQGRGSLVGLLSMGSHRVGHDWSDLAAAARGFPRGSDNKESACNVGDLGSISGSGRSPGGENSNPLQYSCLGNPMNREACEL